MIARLHFPKISDPVHKIGVLSSLYIVKNLISYEYGKRLNDGSIKPFEYIKHLFNIVTDPIDIFKFLGQCPAYDLFVIHVSGGCEPQSS